MNIFKKIILKHRKKKFLKTLEGISGRFEISNEDLQKIKTLTKTLKKAGISLGEYYNEKRKVFEEYSKAVAGWK